MNWGSPGCRGRCCHAQKAVPLRFMRPAFRVDKQGGILVIPEALCVSEPNSARSSLHHTWHVHVGLIKD